MQIKSREKPYPSFLHRAHTHGELIPHFIDYMTDDYCDTFTSDEHHWAEWEGESEISIFLSVMEERFPTIADFTEEVANHLFKTQVNKGRRAHDRYHSPFLSLSGDLRWTLHKSFQKHRMSRNRQEQESGLVIFDTTKLFKAGAQILRVSDLLLFLDSNKRFEGSAINETARYWASNSDEYLCWDFAPKEALVMFVPCDKMTYMPKVPDESFFRLEFKTSQTLGVFRNIVLKLLSIDDYIGRVCRLLLVMLDELFQEMNENEFIKHLVDNLDDPPLWGYALDTDKLVLRERLKDAMEYWVYDVEGYSRSRNFSDLQRHDDCFLALLPRS